MAYDGELVKLENGRWARFQHCSLYGASASSWDGAILMAVELEERFQIMLDDAEGAFEDAPELDGVRRHLHLDESAEGKVSVRLAEASLH